MSLIPIPLTCCAALTLSSHLQSKRNNLGTPSISAISEVVVYGENQDAKLAAKAAKEEALLHEEQEAVYQAEGAGLDPDGNPGEDRAGRRKKATGRAARGGLTTDVRREDAFFELFW